MKKIMLGMGALAACLVVGGCEGNKEDAPKPAASAPAPTASAKADGSTKEAATPPAGEGKCGALGCTGEGTFFDMCDCKAKPQTAPFKAKWSGKYSDFFKQPEFEVTNTTDKDIHWGSVAVYYYDKAGKQLETDIKGTKYKSGRENGSTMSLKPNETKTMTMGFKKESEPKGIDTIEVVFDGWCFGKYDDKASHLCVRVEKAPEERAKSGG
jgi:hypothetical protein